MSIRKEIKKAEEKRLEILATLLHVKSMIRGTFGKVHRKCGKPTCKCNEGKGHLSIRISWTEESVSKTKAISKDDEAWTIFMTSQYKQFRKARKNLREINEQINKLINKLEEEIVIATNKERGVM